MFSVSRTGTDFTVQHYAGEVRYSSAEFLAKNRDRYPEAFLELLRDSQNEFLSGLFASANEENNGKNATAAAEHAVASGSARSGQSHLSAPRQSEASLDRQPSWVTKLG